MNKKTKRILTIIGKEAIDLPIHDFVIIWVYFPRTCIKLIYFISEVRELEIKATYWSFSVSVYKFLFYDIVDRSTWMYLLRNFF